MLGIKQSSFSKVMSQIIMFLTMLAIYSGNTVENVKSLPEEEVVIKLPVDDSRVGWLFTENDILQSCEIELLLKRDDETITNSIIKNGVVCSGWRINKGRIDNVDGETTYLQGSLQHNDVLSNSLTIKVNVQTNLWGGNIMMDGYLPTGVYRSKLNFKGNTDASVLSTSAIELVQWVPSWPVVITKFHFRAGNTLSMMEKTVLRLKKEYGYLLLSDPDRIQTRLYRMSPIFAEKLKEQNIDSVFGLQQYIGARYSIKFSNGTGVFVGPEPFTYLIKHKQGVLNKIKGAVTQEGERLFGLYGVTTD